MQTAYATFGGCSLEKRPLLDVIHFDEKRNCFCCYRRRRRMFKVYIQTRNGKTATLDVATSKEAFENTTIRELKEKISYLFPGIRYDDPTNLRIFQRPDGSALLDEDDKTLGFYNVTDLSTLFIVPEILFEGSAHYENKDIVPRRNSKEEPLMNM